MLDERLTRDGFSTMRLYFSAPGAVFLLIAIVSCDRLSRYPVPPGVPGDSRFERTLRIWVHQVNEGTESVYFENGKIALKGEKKQGNRVGVWKSFSLSGAVVSEGEYVKDWRDGIWRFNDDSGVLYMTMEYRKKPVRNFGFFITHDYGNENGPYVRYFPDGKVEERGNFLGGYQDGKTVRYYPTGKKALEGSYKKDRKEGNWSYYYPDGHLMKMAQYSGGMLDGKLVVYHRDGRVYHISQYKNDKRISLNIVDQRLTLIPE